MQLNRIVLIGRLTRDPEERFTNDGMEISKFCIAVNRMGKPEREGDKHADFFNVVCFRHTAKFVNQYLRRGGLVAVEGRLQIDEYTDREGQRRTWVEVQADNVQNLTPRGDANDANATDEQRRQSGSGGRWENDRDFDDNEQPQQRRRGGEQQRGPAASDGTAARGSRGRGYTDDDNEADPFADE